MTLNQAELIKAIDADHKKTRETLGSLNSDEDRQKLQEATFHLSDIDSSSPQFKHIDFLLELANRQFYSITRLEKKIDQLVLEIIYARAGINRPSLRATDGPINSVVYNALTLLESNK